MKLINLHNILCVVLLVGCGKHGGDDMAQMEPDLQNPGPDLTAPEDMRGVAADMTQPGLDLAMPGADMMMPGTDMRMTTADMLMTADMSMPNPDLLIGTDMTTPVPDLSLPDMTMPDLSSPDLSHPDLSSMPDLSSPDLHMGDGGGGGNIGDPCTDDAGCKIGPGPVCWKSTVLNKMGAEPTPGGYCSSTCSTDTDCGVGGTCVGFSGGMNYCVKACDNATTCRHPGYACLFFDVSGICYPDSFLDCDPKAPMGLCTEAGTMKPGGCLRQAYEDKGICSAVCTLGVGTCPDLGMTKRQCLFYDASGDSFMDAYKGLICLDSPAMPKMPGAACMYLNDCTDGYECDGASNTCHQLCKKGGGVPACLMGMCQDPFMSAAGGPGLCR